MNTRVWIALLLAGWLAAPAAAEGLTLYVAANGSDRWSGRLAAPNKAKTDGPFATLARARDAVRAAKAAGPVTVLLRGGVYALAEPLAFTAADSGTPEAPVTYAAYPGEKPVLSGGRAVQGLKAGPDGLWRASIPAGWRFEQLYVNGVRATRARTPNVGYHYALGSVGSVMDPATGKAEAFDDRAFLARPGDLAPLVDLTPAEFGQVVERLPLLGDLPAPPHRY